jgi:quercetin dioxygenase-like cupin family protein
MTVVRGKPFICAKIESLVSRASRKSQYLASRHKLDHQENAVADQGATFPSVRRIITGHGEDRIAKVIIDEFASNKKYPAGGIVSTLIWSTDATPADISVGEDVVDEGARVLGTAPPSNGTRFSVQDFPPGNRPFIHRTESLDYVIVLAGEIDMDMDNSTVKLKAGDVLVQRGTNHAWVNRSNQPARIAIILNDAKPLGIGTPVTGMANALPRSK